MREVMINGRAVSRVTLGGAVLWEKDAIDYVPYYSPLGVNLYLNRGDTRNITRVRCVIFDVSRLQAIRINAFESNPYSITANIEWLDYKAEKGSLLLSNDSMGGTGWVTPPIMSARPNGCVSVSIAFRYGNNKVMTDDVMDAAIEMMKYVELIK